MTYGQFLLIFLILPLAGLLLVPPRPLTRRASRRMRYSLPLVALIAFVYTTPWDNYLVYRGVWGYGPERVLGVIGYVPLEEYAFFLLQPFLTGLFLLRLLRKEGETVGQAEASRRVRWVGFIGFAITGIAGGLLLAGTLRMLYLGLILAWAAPVLAGMWAYAGDYFWHRRRVFFLAVAFPTVYLWIADRIALGLGIWDISDTYSLGFDPLGLPIEEAVFFLVTNLLVVQGVLLFAFGDVIGRMRRATPAPVGRSEQPAPPLPHPPSKG